MSDQGNKEVNVFEQDQSQVQQPDQGNEVQLPDEVVTFIGEGKKYKDVTEALKSVPHAQTHIERLEAELVAANEKLGTAANIETVLDRLSSPSTNETDNGFSEEDVTRLVTETVKNLNENATKAENQATVNKVMNDVYGDKAHNVIADKARELKLNVPTLKALAESSPEAFLKLVVDEKNQVDNSDLSSGNGSVNIEALEKGFGNGGPKQGTHDWYKAQRKVKGDTWYFSSATQKLMIKDRKAMGEDYYK